jgi:hypothetical protein
LDHLSDLLAAVPLPKGLSGRGIGAEMAATAFFSKQRRLHEKLRQHESLAKLMQQQKTPHPASIYRQTNLW